MAEAARQVSARIDAMLDAERAAQAKHHTIVKILLLGVSQTLSTPAPSK
jgi:hypothetical protein